MRSPIVLLTDFGHVDAYAGVLKGVIHTIYPQAAVLDLCHGVEPQDVARAAYLLEEAYRYFPKGSIFVCVVDPGVGTKRRILCVRTREYYFFAPDNGLLHEVMKNLSRPEIREVAHLDLFSRRMPSSTFHGRDIFSPAAAALAKSKDKRSFFRKLGPRVHHIQPLAARRFVRHNRRLEGSILYFDAFGNAITNIRQGDAKSFEWRRARVVVSKKNIGGLHQTYGPKSSRLIALFNSTDSLEIAVSGGSARDAGRLGKGDRVTVHFKS